MLPILQETVGRLHTSSRLCFGGLLLFALSTLLSGAYTVSPANADALPCGVDAVVGSLHLLGKPVAQSTIDDLTEFYQAPNSMSLLDISQVMNTLAGCQAKAWDLSFPELQSLDQPFIVHLTGSGCSECPGGGHAVAVERLAGDWAIVDGVAGTGLQPSRLLQDSFGGHAVLFSAPFAASAGPRLTVDSYVSDLGPIPAGQRRLCRLTLRNTGTESLDGIAVKCGPDLTCLQAPVHLAPGETGSVELTLQPSHRLDQPSDVRTRFLHLHSSDPLRPRTTVALRFTVVGTVLTQSPIVYFPRVSPENPATRTVTVECRPPVAVVGAAAPIPAVTARVRELGRGVSGIRYAVELTADGTGLEPGLLEVPVRLSLSGADSAGAEIIARLRVPPPRERQATAAEKE